MLAGFGGSFPYPCQPPLVNFLAHASQPRCNFLPMLACLSVALCSC
jgi:hypothetical protein